MATAAGAQLPVAEAASRTVFFVAALLALRLAVRERPTAHADSAEYLLTAESLSNHGTPNVHPADLVTFGRIASRFPLEGDDGRLGADFRVLKASHGRMPGPT